MEGDDTLVSSPIAMARDWQDLFITRDGGVATAEGGRARAQEQRRGFFRRLRENMRKTREALTGELQATLFEDLDDETWERLEEALIMADVGARTTAEIVEQLEREATEGDLDRRRAAERAPRRAARGGRQDGGGPHRPHAAARRSC